MHLTDGTMKCFLVTQSQTANAVKFMVAKKLGLDVKEFNVFGLYVIEEGSSCTSSFYWQHRAFPSSIKFLTLVLIS